MISYGTEIILLPMTAQTGLEMRGILTSCIYEKTSLGSVERICEGALKEFADYKAQRRQFRLDMGSEGKLAECASNTKHEQIPGRKEKW